MPNSDKLLRRRLASLPIPEADRELALRRIAQGESIANTLLALARLFHRPPTLRHAAH
jgi:hypothetical protein